MYFEYRKELLPTLARTSPVGFPIILLFNCVLSPSFESFYIFIMYFLVMFMNFFAKLVVFKPIYKLFGKPKLPFLGLGGRPNGAKSCKFTLDDKIALSFGMPSGHSQLAWTVSIYFLFKIIYKFKNDKDKDKNDKTTNIMKYIWLCLSCIILIGTASYISYSRVYIEGCHTIQQVIVGGILGFVGGFLLYYFEDDVKNLLKL
jgi:membrane-associated phospholipid phosphatase